MSYSGEADEMLYKQQDKEEERRARGPDGAEPCETCEGTGTGWKQDDDPFGERECPRCLGTGVQP